ncbi:hypothetical protein HK104_000060 [Borealophlyctis nickersoniae]|nr:hypothetical protein HK104_000060 [Borealophlyctis nickersoniae]
MGRVARLFLFSSSTIMVVTALGTAMFVYAAFVGAGGFSSVEVFPRAILKGCCSGYRQSTRFLLLYLFGLLICVAAHVIVAHIAHSAADPAYAASSVASLWSQATPDRRTYILSEFKCCGWSDADAQNKVVADDQGNVVCSGPCVDKVTQYSIDAAKTVELALWCTLALETFALLCGSAMMYGLWRKNRSGKEHPKEVCLLEDDPAAESKGKWQVEMVHMAEA